MLDLLLSQALGDPHVLQLRVVTVPNPAAGAEWTFTVPGQEIWRPVALRGQLVTDATVGSRAVRLIFDDGGTEFCRTAPVNTQSVSTTEVWSWFHDGYHGANVSPGDVHSMAIPYVVLPSGYRMRASTLALAAGDQWSAVAAYVVAVNRHDPNLPRLLGQLYDREKGE